MLPPTMATQMVVIRLHVMNECLTTK